MPLKSTINIEVEKGQFEESFQLFNKWKEALKDAPGQWAYYQHRIRDVDKAARKLSTLLEANRDALDDTAASSNRFAESAAKAGQIFHRLALNVKGSAEHLASLTTSLFRFSLITGTISGLLGSGFGVYVLDHTAEQVMGRRRTALGLGVPYGSLQSFETNFGRFGIGAETLGAVSTGLYDFTSPQYRALVAGGGVRGGQNAADATVDLLRKLPALLAGVPDGEIGSAARSKGLLDVLSLQQIVAYLKASKEEREAQIAAYGRDKSGMDIPPDAAQKWTNFAVAMNRAGTIIETSLTNQLTGLTPALTHLSQSAEKFITAFVDSGTATKVINTLGEGLNWLGTELGSTETKEAGKKFLEGVEALYGTLTRWGKFLAGAGKAAWDLYNGNPTWGQILNDLIPDGAPPTPRGPDDIKHSHHPYPSIRYGTWGGPGTIPREDRERMRRRERISTSSPMPGSQSTARSMESHVYVSGGYTPIPKEWTTGADIGYIPRPINPPSIGDALIGIPGGPDTDISNLSDYRNGSLPEIKGFIWHHSAGHGTPEGVVRTLNSRGLGVQWVMDRKGRVWRTLPSGARGAHILPSEINDLTNYNTEGMEIIADDDADLTDEQRLGIANFSKWYVLGHPGVQFFGHGEVNPHHKQATEGATASSISHRIQNGEKDDPYRSDIPLVNRLITRYAGGHPVESGAFSPRSIIQSTTHVDPVPVVIDNQTSNVTVTGSTTIPH